MDGSGGRSVEGDVTGPVLQDLLVDPVLVRRHSGVDSWELGVAAARGEAHHAGLNPPGAVQRHHRTAPVSLHTSGGSVTLRWEPV